MRSKIKQTPGMYTLGSGNQRHNKGNSYQQTITQVTTFGFTGFSESFSDVARPSSRK